MANTAQQQNALPDLTEKDIADALSFIDPDCDRETWFRMAMAVKHELGDSGFVIWDSWSNRGQSYNEKAAQHTWKSVKSHGARGTVTIGTLVHEAMQAGFKFEGRQQLSEHEAAERARKREEARKQSMVEERQRQADAAQAANEIWTAAQDCQVHPYLVRKGVKAHGLRIGSWPLRNKYGELYGSAENTLLIPIRNARGDITSLQGIFSVLPYGFDNDKSYLKDGQKSGSWHMLGKIGDGGTIALVEGYATGASIRDITGWCVLVCFDRANLSTVAEIIRPNAQGQRIVVCADNDQFTDGNPGVTDAKRAAAAVMGEVRVPEFVDLDGKPTDWNDLHQREGADEARRQLGITSKPTKAAANDNVPFVALGYNRGEYYYLASGTRQITRLAASSHSKTNLIQLAPLSWWSMEFPSKQGISWEMAADAMMRDCEARGVFSPDIIRGRGAWLDEGRVVFHFGDQLSVDGELQPVTSILSRHVYEMDRGLPSTEDVPPLSDEDGQRLVEIATKFRWTKPASAALLAGWAALAPLCGALRWRPHIWITGGAGCGKTTVLNDYVHRLMGGMDIFAQGNSTEAGIRQELGSDALPVLFDESEQNNDREASRVQNVLSLIRQASSESGARTLKGTAGGEAMHFMVRSMFCLSSIQVGMKHQADFERLTVLALRPKREDDQAADNWRQLKEHLHWLTRDETLAARLFRRSLELLPVTVQNIGTFVDAAARKFGSVREGDQYGTLLAGCWSMTSCGLATPQEAAEYLDMFEWEEYRENLDADESTKALVALMEAQVRTNLGTASVYEVARAARGEQVRGIGLSSEEADGVLQRYGMRVVRDDLLLSNNSHALSDLLKSTPYAADIRGQLLRVAGVRRHEKSARFSGAVSKCLAIPMSIIMDPTAVSDGPAY